MTCDMRPGEQPREYAHRIAEQGFALLSHAVNACDNPDTPYRYAPEAQREFLRLGAALYALIERGRILPHQIGQARNDEAFQVFMGAVTTKPPRRASRHRTIIK
jgi:hypothetical protein